MPSDNSLTANAMTVLKARYLLRNEKGRITETPSQMFRRAARTVASADRKYGASASEARKAEQEFYELMSSLDFLPNSPTLMNAGTRIGQLSACFVLPLNDSMTSIFGALRDMALIHQSGGGTGFSFSRLRPRGDIVKSTLGVASGSVSFMQIFDEATSVIKQGGKRRGANMAVLSVDHPDILEFVKAKAKKGMLENFNISVAVTDNFMRKVKRGGSQELVNPRTGEIVEKVNARKLFDSIARQAWRSGDPGMLFIDEVNRRKPLLDDGLIEATNPCGELPLMPYQSCLAEETRVVTDRGLETVEALYRRQCNRDSIIIATNLNGKNRDIVFRPATVVRTGKKPVIRVTLANGQSIRLTYDHKILTVKGWKEAGKLNPDEDVIIQNQMAGSLNFSYTKEVGLYQMLGWFTGDGWFTETAGLTFGPQDGYAFKKIVPLWKDFTGTSNKVNEQKNFVRCISTEKHSAIQKLKSYGFKQGKAPVKRLPSRIFTAKKQLQIAFLQGLFCADGSKTLYKSQVSLSSASLELLRDVQLILLNLGIRSNIKYYEIRRRGSSQGQLRVNGESYQLFKDLIGFPLTKYKQSKCDMYTQQRVYTDRLAIRVLNVERAGETNVYDVSEPVTHSLIAEGMIVHNCNLGSINLSNMIAGGKPDWKKLGRTTDRAVHFLDNVIDVNKYPLKEIEKATGRSRKIGLGVMGFAEMLIKMNISYDSERAVNAAEKVMSFINRRARDASSRLGKKRGSFPAFGKSVWKKGGWTSMRNASLTAVAPTGSISIIAGTTSGIEPLFAVSFSRNVLGTRLAEASPLFEEVAKKKGFFSKRLMSRIGKRGSVRGLREVPGSVQRLFATALDVAPEWHVRMQAAFQRHTDGAVSKTVNMPASATVDGVKKIFLLAHKMGCKGTTIYRYGSKKGQVLEMRAGCPRCA